MLSYRSAKSALLLCFTLSAENAPGCTILHLKFQNFLDPRYRQGANHPAVTLSTAFGRARRYGPYIGIQISPG